MASVGASAASVAGQRSEAAAVLHRIEVLDWRRTHMLAVERGTRARLRYLQTSIRGIKGAMSSQQAALTADHEALSAVIVGDYKTTTTDTAAYVLASNSFSDLIERVDEVSRINTSSSALIRRIRVAQRMLAAQTRTYGARLAAVAAQLARQRAAQIGFEQAIAARRAVLAGIDSQIQSQLNAERARRATLAGATGAPPPPGTGGGQGGFTGEASWYGPGFAGHRTADGHRTARVTTAQHGHRHRRRGGERRRPDRAHPNHQRGRRYRDHQWQPDPGVACAFIGFVRPA